MEPLWTRSEDCPTTWRQRGIDPAAVSPHRPHDARHLNDVRPRRPDPQALLATASRLASTTRWRMSSPSSTRVTRPATTPSVRSPCTARPGSSSYVAARSSPSCLVSSRMFAHSRADGKWRFSGLAFQSDDVPPAAVPPALAVFPAACGSASPAESGPDSRGSSW